MAGGLGHSCVYVYLEGLPHIADLPAGYVMGLIYRGSLLWWIFLKMDCVFIVIWRGMI
mgnify:CR=1